MATEGGRKDEREDEGLGIGGIGTGVRRFS